MILVYFILGVLSIILTGAIGLGWVFLVYAVERKYSTCEELRGKPIVFKEFLEDYFENCDNPIGLIFGLGGLTYCAFLFIAFIGWIAKAIIF